MITLFDATRRVNSTPRPFGQGILPSYPIDRFPGVLADLSWSAPARSATPGQRKAFVPSALDLRFNAETSPFRHSHYDVIGRSDAFDRAAADAANDDRISSGIVFA